ncbi:MAG: hypothetical protein WAL63_13310 [Solirubrobacteraceae bacterium]
MEEQAIRSVVTRLARRHPSGGQVIERAAILAEGTDSGEILAWITSHDGQPETQAATPAAHGLHGARFDADPARGSSPPQRYVLPRDALTAPSPPPDPPPGADRERLSPS